jgi:hypothetical protein
MEPAVFGIFVLCWLQMGNYISWLVLVATVVMRVEL